MALPLFLTSSTDTLCLYKLRRDRSGAAERRKVVLKAKINSLISNIGFLKPFDTFKQFQSENYGGDRQWLRCIAQKIN